MTFIISHWDEKKPFILNFGWKGIYWMKPEKRTIWFSWRHGTGIITGLNGPLCQWPYKNKAISFLFWFWIFENKMVHFVQLSGAFKIKYSTPSLVILPILPGFLHVLHSSHSSVMAEPVNPDIFHSQQFCCSSIFFIILNLCICWWTSSLFRCVFTTHHQRVGQPHFKFAKIILLTKFGLQFIFFVAKY